MNINKIHPTLRDLQQAVRVLKKLEVKPVGGFYGGQMSMRALVDILLTFKRPRSTKLYRSLS